MPRKVEEVIAELASQERVLMIGGLAVIAHGLSRPTMDADVWLDPTGGPKKWISLIRNVIAEPERIVTLPGWREVDDSDLIERILARKSGR